GPFDRPLGARSGRRTETLPDGVSEAAPPTAVVARLAGGAVAARQLVAGAAGVGAPGMGAPPGPPGARGGGGRGVHRAARPTAKLPRRARADRHAAAARGDPTGGGAPRPGHVPALEARAGRRDGPAGAPAARPVLLPQGPVPVPLLHCRRRPRPRAGVAR